VKNTCVKYATTMGAGCSPAQPCGTGLSCVTPGDAGAGTCQPSGATVGATCDERLREAAGCDEDVGLYCDNTKTSATYRTCQRSATATPGMPCSILNGVETVCAGAAACFTAGDAGSTCLARAADDQPCDTVTGPACMPPSRCTGTAFDGGTKGTCTPPASSCP